MTYVDNTGAVVEGRFLCNGKEFETKSTDDILVEVLSSEEELRAFCIENYLCDDETHIFK